MNKSVSHVFLVLLAMPLLLVFLFHSVTSNKNRVATASVESSYALSALAEPTLSGMDRLTADTKGQATVTLDKVTNVPTFIRFAPGSVNLSVRQNASVEERASAFFQKYGDVFGIQDAVSELFYLGTNQDASGGSHVSYQQLYKGVPVFAAILRVHFDAEANVTAVNGVFIPKMNINATPTLSAETAANIAVDAVGASNLTIRQNTLQLFRSGLAQGVAGTDHLVYEVEVTDGANIREFFFVDAHSGAIVDQITGIHDIEREVSEASLGNVIWDEGNGNPNPLPNGWAGGTAQQVTDWQNEIDGAGETYDLFANMTGDSYLSYDGADAIMRTVNNDPGINCPNANWNGTSTNYCSGVTGDDTVAHEWGHAYTEYTHGLIYQWQSGALNESYSDIWGEVVDFINGRGLDTPGTARTAGSCSIYGSGSPSNDDTYRWLSGEDDPAFGGAIRDMWNPGCYNDPGKVSDTNYWCTTTDSGGVHTNSGVPNHAFALLVDGGTYNGVTVSGIGLTKAAHIYWQAQSVYQTPISDFADHADALEASCSDLIGVNLNDLSSGGSSGEMITAGNCTEVANALEAVEMRDEPDQCNFQPMLDANTPALCSAGSVTTIYSDTLEMDPTTTWTISHMDVYSTTDYDWEWVSSLPDGRSGSALFAIDPQDGSCNEGIGDVSGVMHADSPMITIPASDDITKLAFDHWLASEATWDGGNLKISVNGGDWELVDSADYTFNAYNTTLSSTGAGSTNPLAGEPAFSGTDGGQIGGSWYQSQIDLSDYAVPGDTIQLRYDFGMDGCTGLIGWFVDNVHVYSCSAPGISVTPTELTSTQLPTTTVTHTLAINNSGNEDLTWDIFEDNSSAQATASINVVANASNERQMQVVPAEPQPQALSDSFIGGVLADGGFEEGSPNPYWNESSTNFGTPLCNSSCGGPPAHTGSWYVWFGGISAASETGSVDQDITIPNNATTLSFWLLMGVNGGTGFMNVDIDGTNIFTVTEADVSSYNNYTEVTLDITAFADGGTHNLRFLSTTNAGGTTNFLVDDVNVVVPAPIACDAPEDIPWLSVSPTSGTTAPGASAEVDVTFDAMGYGLGVYTGTLCVNSNDPLNPQIEVPVTMIVADFGVELTPSAAMTGTAGTTVTYTLSITNTGTAEDTFDLDVTGNTWPTMVPNSITLDAGETADLVVTVDIPSNADSGDMDVATVTANSPNGGVSAAATLTTTAVAAERLIYMPFISKD